MAGLCRQLQAEEILELQGGDDHANPGGEAHDHRVGHELDQATQARQPQRQQDQPGHQRHQQESAQPVLLGDWQQDHHERRSGPGNIEPRAAAERDQQPTDDTGIQAVLRRHTHRNGQRHGQGNGDNTDRDAGQQVAAKMVEGISLPEAVAQGDEQRQSEGAAGHDLSCVDNARVWLPQQIFLSVRGANP